MRAMAIPTPAVPDIFAGARRVTRAEFLPDGKPGSGVLRVWLLELAAGKPGVWWDITSRLRGREIALKVRSNLPDLRGLLPWERELLMPVVDTLLEKLATEDHTRDDEDDDGDGQTNEA